MQASEWIGPNEYPTPFLVVAYRQALLLETHFLRVEPLTREEAAEVLKQSASFDDQIDALCRAGKTYEDPELRQLYFRREAATLFAMGKPMSSEEFRRGLSEAAGTITDAGPTTRPVSRVELDRLIELWGAEPPKSWRSLGRELPRRPQGITHGDRGTTLYDRPHERTSLHLLDDAIIVHVAEEGRGHQWYQITDETLARLEDTLVGARDSDIRTAELYFERMGARGDFNVPEWWQRIYDLTRHQPKHELHVLAKRHLHL